MSSDEDTHPNKKRCCEVSHANLPHDVESENEESHESNSPIPEDDLMNNFLQDHLESLPSSGLHHEESDASSEADEENEDFGCVNINMLVDTELKASGLFDKQVDTENHTKSERQHSDEEGDPNRDETIPSEENSLLNFSFDAHNDLQNTDIGRENDCSSQFDKMGREENDSSMSFNEVSESTNPYSESEREMPFDLGNHLYSEMGISLLQYEDDGTEVAAESSTTNIDSQEVANSSADCDTTVLATDVEDGQMAYLSSTPIKQANFAASRQLPSTTYSPIKLEDLFVPPKNESESESESEESSQMDGENSDDSNSSQEEDISEYFVSRSLLGQDLMNESLVSVFEPDLSFLSAAHQYQIELYSIPGGHVCPLSVQEAILQLMNLYVKDKLSKKGLQRLVQTFCNFLPDNHNLPTSSYQILSYVQSLAPPVSATKHYYCVNCSYYHGESNAGQCDVCGDSMFAHFYIFDVPALVKYFFESRQLADIIDRETEKSGTRNAKTYTNLKDGSAYQSLNRNRGKYDLNIILNADGVRVKKGSKSELWLAMFTIVELPIHLQRAFVTIVGVWYHRKKPDMRVFLKPFAESLEYLDQNGVEWTHPTTGEVHKSRVRLLVTVLDAPARAMVQNVMMFNSRYGCNLCEIKTKKSVPLKDRKAVRVYHYVDKPVLRDKDRMLDQAQKAVAEGKKNIKGVRGPSVLSIIPSADVSKCVVPEYLHSVLIGVVKQLVGIWCNKPGPWCIANRISEIDIFLSTFKHPNFVHRSLRQLKTVKNWKASDYYYFLLFEGVPALKGHLPDPYLEHFMLLVKAIFTLIKASIKEAEVTEAELLLKLFVNQFLALYGDRQLTSNVHQLLHLAFCVRLYGPLFCFSAFPYEDLNGMIARATHGTIHIDAEIVNNIKICQGIFMLENIVRGLHGTNVNQVSVSEGEFIGTEVSCKLLSPEELSVLPDSNPIVYARAKLGYDNFTSKIYKPLNSEDFNIMCTINGKTEYGLIKYFAKCNTGNYVVIQLFVVDHTSVFYHKATLRCIEQFIPVEVSNQLIALKFSDVVSTIVKVGKIGCYVYVRPHLYRFVL